eukprot:GEZU01032681.1.p1 GENE.GEZU01032681.1~~GEZU01032681.1.p1  ORF type:complete len:213 (+),score=5.26 GEZU01032681.1:89-727(+)
MCVVQGLALGFLNATPHLAEELDSYSLQLVVIVITREHSYQQLDKMTGNVKPEPLAAPLSTRHASGSVSEEQFMELNRMALELLGLVESRRDKCFQVLQSLVQIQDNSCTNCSTASASVTSLPATTQTPATSPSSGSSRSPPVVSPATPKTDCSSSMTQTPTSTNRNGSVDPPTSATTASTSAAAMRPKNVPSTILGARGRIVQGPPTQPGF